MIIVDSNEIEQSLAVIHEWSQDNATNSIDWRRLHAAANVLALALYRGSEYLSKLREVVSEKKQTLKQAEALAKLTALGMLLSGRAVLPDGHQLEEKCSYSVAKELAVSFVPNDPQVMLANVALLQAEAKLTAFENRLDALRELSQGAKSSAKLLQAEIG
jgi:hypothetical protein